jgi:hypothetical protein
MQKLRKKRWKKTKASKRESDTAKKGVSNAFFRVSAQIPLMGSFHFYAAENGSKGETKSRKKKWFIISRTKTLQ